MADVPHYCAACGEIHGGSSRESEEIKIAKINADRDIEVARIQRGETKIAAEAEIAATEVVADAQVEVAVVEAEAAVDEAVVENEVLEEIVSPPEADPVIIPVAGDGGDDDGEAPGPPEVEPAKPEKSGGGYWDSYR